MKTILMLSGIVAAFLAFISGCSQGSRDDAIQRTTRAAVALNGGAPDGTPDVVREQRERERNRQNTQWTPENQAKHPVEYCRRNWKNYTAMSRNLKSLPIR